MTTRIALLVLFGVSLAGCDGSLVIGGPADSEVIVIDTAPGTASAAEQEIGTAETSDDLLWEGGVETLKSPWTSGGFCKLKGRWAATCTNGDGCCPSFCNSENDDDCPAPPEAPPTDPTEPTPDPQPTCGDGNVDAGEVCDGDCPSSCDSGDACTIGTLTGSADTCDAVCEYDSVTACANGDGCCPMGCTTADDDDCAAVCGNDLVEANELCDGNCPSSCDDNDACTTDRLDGSASTCDAMCGHTVVTACSSGDGCCPTGCTYDLDQDCPMPPPDDPPAIDCTDASTWPQTWRDFESQVITLVNQRRAAGADCGSRGSFGAAGAVSMNPQMQQASRCHSWDMDVNMYFNHTSLDGRSFVQRLQDAGYGGSPRGENIAAGYSTPDSVVNGWMNSDGHCANIMNSGINRMGIGYTKENRATWTMTTGVGD